MDVTPSVRRHPVQAERIMEAVELYREETAKMKEHRAICKAAGKEVRPPASYVLGDVKETAPEKKTIVSGLNHSDQEMRETKQSPF